MRRPTIVITATVAACGLVLAGCGGDDPGDDPPAATAPPTGPPATVAPPPETGPPEHGWDSNPQVDFETGELTAPGFNDLIDEESPDWATDPEQAVSVLLRLDIADGTVDTELDSADGDPVLVVTNSELADDSVTAIRYRVVLSEGGDGLYRLAEGGARWRCQPDRGHQDFSTEPCV